MLITKIILRDFGVYRGENEFDLSCDDNKPIILIGGTNGSGKTTLFDSVMLCFYGMASFGKKITRASYEKYLKQKIHRYLGTPVSADHASIIVQFKFFHDNKVAEYQVDRTWVNEDGKIKENLTIKRRDNEKSQFKPLDNVEKSYWQSFIEDLIPRGIARLFFFDGEKIVQIAEEGNEDIAIKTSFNSLLGIDLVEQLKSDLQINLVRNLGINEEAKLEFERYQKEKQETEQEIARLMEKKGQQESEMSQLQKEIEDLEAKVAKIGGEFAIDRDELRSKQMDYKLKLETMSQNIRNLCSMSLPFSLIPRELEQLKMHVQNDETILKNNFEKEILTSNFKEIQNDIKSEEFWKQLSTDKTTSQKIISRISTLLEEKIKCKTANQEGIFNLSLKDNERILSVIDEANGEILTELETQTKQFNEITEELDKIDTALINAPKDDEIGPLISKLNELNKKLGMFQAEITHIEQQASSRTALIRHIQVKMRDALGKQHKNKKSQEKAELTDKILNVLDEYSEKLKIKKIGLLEDYLLEGIQTLMHKENFIHKVTIDKETFEITLYREDEIEIPKDLLSKGEQQMFATAVLWALAKTSGRPLPFLIDTPLARLDIQHRTNLVEEFFPIASHQVVIFSTNAEIDAAYYQKLYPYITRSYSMEYLPNKGKTKQHPRYFWDEKGEEIIEIH